MINVAFSFDEAATCASKLANELEEYGDQATPALEGAFCAVMQALLESDRPFFETTLMLKHSNRLMPLGVRATK